MSQSAQTIRDDQARVLMAQTAVRHFGYGLAEEADILTLYLSFLCFLARSSPENGWDISLIPWKRKPCRKCTWKENSHLVSTYYVPGHCAMFYTCYLFGSSQKLPVRQAV